MSQLTPTPIYVDLDRTLFQTEQLPTIVEQLAQLYPQINADRFYDARTEYYVEAGTQYYHDMSAQLESVGLEPTTVYRALRTSPIADNRLLFPGGEALADWLSKRGNVFILTYGADAYQRCKAALCPALDRLPVITTLENKATWLQREVGDGPALLIDDKPLGNELPNAVAFIQVALEGKSAVRQGDWPAADSLGAVLALLQQRETEK